MGQQPQTRREIKEAQRGRGWLMPTLVGVLAVAVLAGGVVWWVRRRSARTT